MWLIVLVLVCLTCAVVYSMVIVLVVSTGTAGVWSLYDGCMIDILVMNAIFVAMLVVGTAVDSGCMLLTVSAATVPG